MKFLKTFLAALLAVVVGGGIIVYVNGHRFSKFCCRDISVEDPTMEQIIASIFTGEGA